MDAQATTAVLVPMRVSAYCNYSSSRPDATPRDGKAFLAPIPDVDRDGISSTSADIYADMQNPHYGATFDPQRKTLSREGIYVHWEIPKVYKTASVTSSGQDGQFKTLPDRYVVLRSVSNTDQSTSGTGVGSWYPWPLALSRIHALPSSPDQGMKSRIDLFVVDASRKITPDGTGTQDLDVSSTPYVDPSSQQVSHIGTTTSLLSWKPPGDDVQTVDSMTVHQTTNPFFADFQPLNAGVFSMFDNLLDIGGSAPHGGPWTLVGGTVSYTVVGWHTNDGNDPLHMDKQKLLDVLNANRLVLNSTCLNDPTAANVAQAYTMVHGSLHNITWGVPGGALKNAADSIQMSFRNGSHPVAVGSNSLDALFGWLRANESVDAETPKYRAQVRKLQTWVMDFDDSIDSQLQADDMLASNNWSPLYLSTTYTLVDTSQSPAVQHQVQVGVLWHYDVDDSATTAAAMPNLADTAALTMLNQAQMQLNAIARQDEACRRTLFDLWWSYKSSGNANSQAVETVQQQRLNLQKQGLLLLPTIQKTLDIATQSSPEPTFYMQRDPTLLVAGACSQWPSGADVTTTVRLDGQDSQLDWVQQINKDQTNSNWCWPGGVAPPTQDSALVAINNLFVPAAEQVKLGTAVTVNDTHPGVGQAVIDTGRRPALVRLLAEGVLNSTSDVCTTPVAPQYFGSADRMGEYNGWFPLFVEWEVEYYQIPFEHWAFDRYGPESRWGYGLSPGWDASTANLQGSYRVLSGRAPIVPQASASLKSVLQQVFARMNPDQLDAQISHADRDQLLLDVTKPDYLSTNMSGFTDQLLMRQQGTHAVPLLRTTAGGVVTLTVPSDVLTQGANIGLTESDFLAMSDTSETVPSVNYPTLGSDASFSPFQPCTHGQFRFTKLNIVDRWGQVVHGINPTMATDSDGSAVGYQTPLFPALGELYSVQPLQDGTPNTVLKRTAAGSVADTRCSFVQIPPCINQHARVNFDFMQYCPDFMQPAGSGSAPAPVNYLQPIYQHQNPVHAYIVFNSANASLQLFSPEGYFVSEYPVVPDGEAVAASPFGPGEHVHTSFDQLLWQFLGKLETQGYVKKLYSIISSIVANVQAMPGHAAETMQAIMGRPLALVVVGASMELAQPPRTSLQPSASGTLADGYTFQAKLGDVDNVYDGTYCLFPQLDGKAYDIPAFDFANPQSDVTTSSPIDLVPLKPSWVDSTSSTFVADRCSSYTNFAALVDPFTPMHAYTALLPVTPLRIPQWAVSRAMSQMASFYKVGPLVTTTKLPTPDSTSFVGAKSTALRSAQLPADGPPIKLPALGTAGFSWMQPVMVREANRVPLVQLYNMLGIDSQLPAIDKTDGPYTAIEGYLVQRQPFGVPDAEADFQA